MQKYNLRYLIDEGKKNYTK